jgi:hypothetical protein
VLYLIIQILLLKFASYEVEPSPEVQEPVEDIIDAAEAEKPEYTQEQIEIMERYAALESQAMTEAGTVKETEKVVENDNGSAEDICDHTPVNTWKNYIPSKYDFTCDKCGKPIVFAPPVKKRMNILLLVVVLVILMPSSINLSVDFWKFGLLSLLVLVIGVAIQFFFVRRGPFVDKDQDDSKKK